VAEFKPLFRNGELISGTFEVRSLLGIGGMGQVYEAHDTVLGRSVAIKASLPTLNSVFLRDEARALATFSHPAVVTIYTIGAHKGIDYIVMERLYGTSLAVHLARRAKHERLMFEEVIDLSIALADGLALLHRAALAHRDLKPSNIMLAPGNRVVLMDFGLVLPEADTTASSEPCGTPQYMAPETVARTTQAGDRRLVDLYALGVIIYEMLTGSVPFGSDDPDIVMQRQLRDPVPTVSAVRSDVPGQLNELVAALMAKAPAERPQTAEAVAWSLRQVQMRAQTRTDAPLSVLIVDDDIHAVRLLDLYVRAAAPSAFIRTAASGEEGLALARESVPDLMLLDLQMPGMNGLELAMYLRATHLFDRCRIVALSGRAHEHDIRLLRELGITEFIPKTAQTRQLLGGVVQDVIRQRARSSWSGKAVK
jgi:serine/threonine protein kinase